MKRKLKIPVLVTNIIRKINNNGFKAYVVGGVLRDMLLKRSRSDFDIATDAKPKDIEKIFKKTIPTGIKHGTVTVLERGNPFEITTFRIDGDYSDSRRPDKVRFTSDLIKDLSRRDFTINAMAYDQKKGEIIDPHNGIEDLKEKIIRTVGDPLSRFSEDALRVLRAARFASTLNFKIENKTFAAMNKISGKIKKLSAERIRDEIMKILSSEKPSVGLKLLKDCGVFDIIFPELIKATEFGQGGLHEYDLLTHSFKAADEAPSNNPLLRLAGLLHDTGKIPTRKVEENGDYTFYGHDLEGERIASSIMKRLKFSNKEIDYVSKLIRNHMFNYNSQWSDGAVRRLIKRVGKQNIDDLLKLRETDIQACGENRKPPKQFFKLKNRIKRIFKEDMALKVQDLKVDGSDVMKILNIKQGRKVGEVLNYLLDIVIENNKKNKRTTLLKLIKDKYIK